MTAALATGRKLTLQYTGSSIPGLTYYNCINKVLFRFEKVIDNHRRFFSVGIRICTGYGDIMRSPAGYTEKVKYSALRPNHRGSTYDTKVLDTE